MKDNKVHILAVMASLGTFVFLAGSLISGLIICYSLIEILLPEVDSFQVSGFEYGFGIFYALSNATAFFIVFFPLYIYSSRHMQRAIKKDLQVGKVIETIQNIVIAVIIAISILIVAVSAVILIIGFLNTGLPTTFLLKIFITILIAILIFIYYKALWKRDFDGFFLRDKFFVSVVCVVALLLVSYSVYRINPLTIADRRESQDTIRALQNIKSEIEFSKREEKGLPTNLEEINNYHRTEEKDGEIEYKKLSDTNYELCANIKTIAKNQDSKHFPAKDFKYNKTGRNCWTFELLNK